MVYELMDTLADAFSREQARIRECLVEGAKIGPPGFFYCAMAHDLLERADKAVMEQDVVAMIRIYKEMKDFKS